MYWLNPPLRVGHRPFPTAVVTYRFRIAFNSTCILRWDTACGTHAARSRMSKERHQSPSSPYPSATACTHAGSRHPRRRMWTTERKHPPVQDVAATARLKSTAVLQGIYQQADEATMLQVVMGAGELRGAK